jgi:hypothetical protein
MSVYRGNACPDCRAEGRIERCEQCGGAGTLVCDLCGGRGTRVVRMEGGETRFAPCVCESGYYTCAACSGGTGVCGRCGGTGFLDGV